METLYSLIDKNTQFHHKHGLIENDVIRANELINLIEKTRNIKEPKPGDIIICVGPKAEYKRGHLEKEYTTGFADICTEPMLPFVNTSKSEKDDTTIPWFNTSGGYWLSCTDLEQYESVETNRPKLFCTWGNCGPCAGGAFNFTASVNVWRLFKENIY